VRYGALSGGQKRRLHVALAFVADPELVVLDEPTSGLDPHSRRRIWTVIEERRAAGSTILVTTHYLEEAEEYCDHVVVIDRARVVAAGDPDDLLRKHGLGVRVSVPADLAVGVGDALLAHPEVAYVEPAGDRLFVYGRDASVHDLVTRASRRCEAAFGLELRPARLEDLFLLLTGREYQEQ
jgi:ABC-2 type transport system ATP-binding protein